jgi:hypothetical protein
MQAQKIREKQKQRQMDIENSNITTKEKIEKLTAMRNYS